MKRAYYSDTIAHFCDSDPLQVFGVLSSNDKFSTGMEQKDAWLEEIKILQHILTTYQGSVFFEYSIPRMGRRIDVVVIIGPVIFILEFKIGKKNFKASDYDQIMDYALDLKNFHEPSHNQFIAPILIATHAKSAFRAISVTPQDDKFLFPIKCNEQLLGQVIKEVLHFTDGIDIDPIFWESGRYCPTPTIVEAAMALYRGHSVDEISRSDASAINLSQTSEAISEIIRFSQSNACKSICFVTGVPGAGKTLVGLNIATQHINKANDLYSVFLSGNGPLVAILREALARDKVRSEMEHGRKKRKGEAMSEVKMFIQNVHNFRDSCLVDLSPPIEHVALFDEAQRAWDLQQTRNFMIRKKNKPNFSQSEPEFLISCLDRHKEWAVVVCLVGGGQEINTGEAGIGEWMRSIQTSFPHWNIYISSRLHDSEYGAGKLLDEIRSNKNVMIKDELHLSVSMRSFRAENVSLLVKQLLDLDQIEARKTLAAIGQNYPIVLTRDMVKAKKWLKDQARGTERYGILVSSQAERLKPHAIDVKSPMNPIHWFLNEKDDIRSSYYLEAVATEFDVQGLELDWACITWDADFRYTAKGWEHKSFCGNKWYNIKKEERKTYLKNAYRVLLTRARQGMVIVVPPGDPEDQTRNPAFYDPTFQYISEIGFKLI
ncbi:MAG TPA: DUF2075 domain-containing protein [Bacteroidota bacterium]|nr:DUF2075 domain-containing protein [Bacteroidota bacterium]